MTKTERKLFIKGLIGNIQKNLLVESCKYPETWNGIELRWRIADVFGQVVFGESGGRKGKRYLDYKNVVLTEDLI